MNNKGFFGAIALGVIVVIGVVLLMLCTVRIPAGYVAVKYNVNGGIQDDVLTQGWHIVSPTTKVTKYSVALEQSYLTKGDQGDSEDNERFSASSLEGKAIDVDLTFTYQYKPENVVEVFKTFRGKDGKEVRDSFTKPNIISWSKEVLGTYKVSDLLGSKRADANKELTDYLAKKFEPYGITISNVSLINLEVDKTTKKAINKKITAQQEAETQTIKNKTKVEKAEADAKASIIAAEAEAQTKVIEAEAEAKANKKLSDSITDNLIKMEEMKARQKHGWVTISGANTVVKDK